LVIGTIHVQNLTRKFDQLVMGPTMLLGATRAPLSHCFILRKFLEYFKYVFQKNINFLKKILNIIKVYI
jgi:hypothetical protein